MSEENPTEQCIFCQIASKKIPTQVVYEDDIIMAIMDINPLSKGHILLFPKKHYPIIQMMPQAEFEHIMSHTKYISKAQKKICVTDKNTLYYAAGQVAGQQMPHAILHLIAQEPNETSKQFAFNTKEVNTSKIGQLIQQNLPIMLNPKDQLARILEQNPQLTDLIRKNPQEFKEKVKQNPQLNELFSQIDIEELSQQLKQ